MRLLRPHKKATFPKLRSLKKKGSAKWAGRKGPESAPPRVAHALPSLHLPVRALVLHEFLLELVVPLRAAPLLRNPHERGPLVRLIIGTLLKIKFRIRWRIFYTAFNPRCS